eukprot:3480249-Rhodomonas_salina.2
MDCITTRNITASQCYQYYYTSKSNTRNRNFSTMCTSNAVSCAVTRLSGCSSSAPSTQATPDAPALA